ncbi:MAG: hypothetical protein F6K09_15520 [Merismopedia sp. SIO2A8]|nr:hypothetical protein [Symploca sp. SIO2B6]NET50094.1 hypothetical protein [Merismopedia sp. SIO2A8]
MLGCCWILPHGDFRELGTVPQFWIGSSLMGVGFILSWRLHSVSSQWFWAIAIVTRLILIPMYPGDDIWRYLWEGHIQNLGFSPYELAPDATALVPHHTAWWSLINHRDTSAIYPPITQWGFRILAALTPSVWLFKVAFTLADLGICWGLSRRFGYSNALIYAWNPLVIYSFAGGGHYDSWFVLPLVLAWITYEPSPQPSQPLRSSQVSQSSQSASPPSCWGRWLSSAVLVGISIAVKWITLPVLVFLLWQAIRKKQFQWAGWMIVCGTIPLIISALPFCQLDSCPLVPVSSGFVAYGRSAELLPHLVYQLWPPSLKMNWIYALPLGVAVLWLLGRSRSLLQFTEGYLSVLLLLSPVIHAWYFTWLVPLAAASRNLGIRLVSLSSFIYFVLQHRIALDGPWQLTPLERVSLWLPFILGWVWTNVTRDR